jgi:DICT domain-containing protein
MRPRSNKCLPAAIAANESADKDHRAVAGPWRFCRAASISRSTSASVMVGQAECDAGRRVNGLTTTEREETPFPAALIFPDTPRASTKRPPCE